MCMWENCKANSLTRNKSAVVQISLPVSLKLEKLSSRLKLHVQFAGGAEQVRYLSLKDPNTDKLRGKLGETSGTELSSF